MSPERAFVEYRAYVAAIGRKVIGVESDVDDVVQDVFLMVHRDLHRLRNPESLRDWLATIATRSAHRSLRQRVADRMFGVHDPVAMENAPDSARGPELEADLAGSLERLRHLPEHLRHPWLLKHVQEWSLESIARVSGCSLSTIQRRLREADEAMHERSGARARAAPTPECPSAAHDSASASEMCLAQSSLASRRGSVLYPQRSK
jgi:RNA polymerase sigma-70 factor, ECF subfamily